MISKNLFTVIFRPLRPLRPFDLAQDMLCGRYSETDRCTKRTLRKPSCPEPVVSPVEPCLRGENYPYLIRLRLCRARSLWGSVIR